MLRREWALLALGAVAAGGGVFGCDDGSKLRVTPTALEDAIRETVAVPASAPSDLDVSCTLPKGDGIEDRWNCVVQAKTPATDAEEAELRVSYPDDRGVRVELAVWVAADDPDDDFPAGSVAAVQVGGDGLYEGGGAAAGGGCCVEIDQD